MILYSFLTYGIVAVLALILVFKGIHTAFIWPTLSTLVTFNVFLKTVHFGQRYCYCIVGGFAWEGFSYHSTNRTELEEEYIHSVSIVYRNLQERTDKDIDPDVILTTFDFFEKISGYAFIYLMTCLFFLVCMIVAFATKNPRFQKMMREFGLNANIRFCIIYVLPLLWIVFMFFIRVRLVKLLIILARLR
jgi:hypothetical protein